MAEMKLGRPKKEMMLAVNALIAKDKSAADELVTTHKLDRNELERRVNKRNGEPYGMTRKKGQSTISKKKSIDLRSMVKGWKIVALLEGVEAIESELGTHSKDDVQKVREARGSLVDLRKRVEEAEKALNS